MIETIYYSIRLSALAIRAAAIIILFTLAAAFYCAVAVMVACRLLYVTLRTRGAP